MLKIIVVKNNHPLGELSQTSSSLHPISFKYFKDISKNSYLSGLEEKENFSDTLFSIFENLLPEHEQLDALKAKHNINNQVEILLHLNNIHGSFEFYTPEEFKTKTFSLDEVFNYEEKKEEILQQDYSFPNILEYSLNIPNDKLYPIEFNNNKLIGLSGFQYKFSVMIDEKNKVISYDSSDKSEYIMKPYNKGYSTYKKNDKDSSYIPYLLVNEHLFMSLAREFGLSVPYNAIIKHGNDYHYIIKRYDRYNGLKIDHRDILTSLLKPSREKYKVSALDAMKEASEYLDNIEMRELFRFFIFSIIIAHGDFHAKNFSLICKTNSLEEKKMQLAPYYDISTTGIYKGLDSGDIGMKVLNKNTKITIEDLVWLGEKFNIDEDDTKKYVTELTATFKKLLPLYIDKLPNTIKTLPIYKDRYNRFDTLEIAFSKYLTKRITYIDKYLLKDIDNTTKNKDIWS